MANASAPSTPAARNAAVARKHGLTDAMMRKFRGEMSWRTSDRSVAALVRRGLIVSANDWNYTDKGVALLIEIRDAKEPQLNDAWSI